MTREEAIERLVYLGHKAKPRTWNLGETILVPIGQVKETEGISAFPGVLYICPEKDGTWYITDHAYVERDYPNLEEAVAGAHDYLTFIKPFVRKL